MELVREFNKLEKGDVAIAGGKGASLGEMTKARIPVPEGFVVLSGAFERFIEKTKLKAEIDSILHKVNHEEIHTVENASGEIKALISEAKMPKDIEKEINSSFKKLGARYVAVRSSATSEDSSEAAWAGQLESYLNTTKENLMMNVKKCWASLFSSRAIFYRFEKGLHDKYISVAVVVQKMANSEKSGIAFSVHPVTQDYNQLIIEAGFGLGEAIVSGQITPDSYIIEKDKLEIIEISVNEQAKGLFRKDSGGNDWRDLGNKGKEQVLDKKEIIELSKLVIKIEKHYGFPVDVEWAKEKGKFCIVQSRPITTLTNKEENIPENLEKQKIEKVFSRDFSLIALQMDYLPESSLIRPWADGENPYKPYLIFWRNDGTSKIYFNSNGVEWIKKQLINQVRKNKGFLRKVEKNVRDGIKYIRPIYEQKQTLEKEELVKFVNEFVVAYHWIEAMWWIKSMADNELKDVDCSNIIALRKETEELSAATDIVIRKSLASLYKNLGNLSAMISFDELKEKVKIDQGVLKKRNEGFVLINNEIVLDRGFFDVLNEKNLFLEEENIEKNISILKGEIVSKGKYKGEISRVMGHNDFEKVKKGDIIVSPMTMVDFLPIMKIAGAFITDEGGTLCHAAIVSRELNKPCVVGTNYATQILEDGDLVEVDADNGIVRKLTNNYK